MSGIGIIFPERIVYSDKEQSGCYEYQEMSLNSMIIMFIAATIKFTVIDSASMLYCF